MSRILDDFIKAGVLHPFAIELLAPVLLSVLAESSRAVSTEPALREQAHDLMGRVLEALRITARTT